MYCEISGRAKSQSLVVFGDTGLEGFLLNLSACLSSYIRSDICAMCVHSMHFRGIQAWPLTRAAGTQRSYLHGAIFPYLSV